MNCPACNFEKSKLLGNVWGTEYHECVNCKTIFSGELEQGGMVGGGYAYERSLQNSGRIERFIELAGKGATIIDWGCGNGELVHACTLAGFMAYGYDKFSEQYKRKPRITANLVSMVEVIEHLTGKKLEQTFADIDKCTVPGSLLYIETCFADVCGWGSFYVEPKVGHSTIWSYAGMDEFMWGHKWALKKAINSTVRVYEKVSETIP